MPIKKFCDLCDKEIDNGRGLPPEKVHYFSVETVFKCHSDTHYGHFHVEQTYIGQPNRRVNTVQRYEMICHECNQKVLEVIENIKMKAEAERAIQK